MAMKMEDLMVINADSDAVLGKFIYYSLSSVLVPKDKLKEICTALDFPFKPSDRKAPVDSFRSATGDIFERRTVTGGGSTSIFKVYCRDNRGGDPETVTRELVKETLGVKTNDYKKLANMGLVRADGTFFYENLAFDSDVDPLPFCQKGQELFELYLDHVGRSQIDTILENYLHSMQAVKLMPYGKLYFIPRNNMARVGLLEDFIAEVEEANQLHTGSRMPLRANSMYVADDAKQREEMAHAFYATVKKEIEEYQEQMDRLVKGGCKSSSVARRWATKLQSMEQMKRNYEELLNRELNDLADDFTAVNFLLEELQAQTRKGGLAAAA